MQSFVLGTICCILITIVTPFRSCYKSLCSANCYFKQNGFGFGNCDGGSCHCTLTRVYIFDGIGGNLRNDHIANSLKNVNTIQRSISFHGHKHDLKSPTSPTTDENNKIWKNIEKRITEQFPFIKESGLENLKEKIIGNQKSLNNFLKLIFKYPLENALNEMKKSEQNTSKECDALLLLLQNNNTENKIKQNVNLIMKAADSNNKIRDAPLKVTPPIISPSQTQRSKQTSPQGSPASTKNLNTSTPRGLATNTNGSTKNLASKDTVDTNIDKQKNSNLDTNKKPENINDKNNPKNNIVIDKENKSNQDNNKKPKENNEKNNPKNDTKPNGNDQNPETKLKSNHKKPKEENNYEIMMQVSENSVEDSGEHSSGEKKEKAPKKDDEFESVSESYSASDESDGSEKKLTPENK